MFEVELPKIDGQRRVRRDRGRLGEQADRVAMRAGGGGDGAGADDDRAAGRSPRDELGDEVVPAAGGRRADGDGRDAEVLELRLVRAAGRVRCDSYPSVRALPGSG